MAIVLKCSQCQEQLEVDDAFAGGICRCVHCGALSHVPMQPTELDKKGRPTTPPEMARPVVGSPEELAHVEIVQAREFIAARKRMGVLAILMSLLAVGMIAFAIYVGLRVWGGDDQDADGPVNGNSVPVGQFKDFCGLELPGEKVAFLLNVGGSMQSHLDYARGAIVKSLEAVGKRQFVVVTWPTSAAESLFGEGADDPAVKPKAFPDAGLASADAESTRRRLADWLNGFSAAGVKVAPPAVELALARGADTLVLICAADLDAGQADAIRTALKGKSVKLRAVVMGFNSAEGLAETVKLVGDEKNLAAVTGDDLDRWLRPAR